MKSSRAWIVWLALGACAVMVVGAMTLLTRNVLASQQERAAAEARAELEEQTRLALWRMDAAGAAILLQENQRPPADYEAAGKAEPSPFGVNPLVKLHFEVRNGGLRSPDFEESHENMEALRQLLSENGDISALLTEAAAAGESAWQAVPKDAIALKKQAATLKTPEQAPPRYSQSYQQGANMIEMAQRAKVLESQSKSSTALNNFNNASLPQSGAIAPAQANLITGISSMRPAWIGGELFLLRKLTLSGGRLIQGVWLDHAAVRRHLLAEIPDLLPAASLHHQPDNTNNPLALVSLPFLLERGAIPDPPAPRWSTPLGIGWVAVLFALAALALLVRGIMRLSERRASFVSAVTHELRTPLTTFRLYSDMLESGAVKEQNRGHYLSVLSREADRLSHLVENVLAFSRIERGNARSQVRTVPVGEMLESFRERLDTRLHTTGLTLDMETTDRWCVRADTSAVEHILFNLIDNTAKYAPASEPTVVEIRTRPAGRHIAITVRDHGPGIPAADHTRIFRAFHKSAREAAESQPGVGLGLALSRRLAKGQHGDLRCVPVEAGATFELLLPATTPESRH